MFPDEDSEENNGKLGLTGDRLGGENLEVRNDTISPHIDIKSMTDFSVGVLGDKPPNMNAITGRNQ